MALILKQRDTQPELVIDDAELTIDTPVPGSVRCPRCAWRPRPSDRWSCLGGGAPEYFAGGCGTSWNTFETGGRCPGCSHQWQWTSCHRCEEWSLHVDWYEGSRPV